MQHLMLEKLNNQKLWQGNNKSKLHDLYLPNIRSSNAPPEQNSNII